MIKRKGGAIPKEDLEAINRSFENDQSAQAITKDPSGERVSAEQKEVNPKTYVLGSFGGRILKHQKSVIPKGGKQIFVGNRGDLFDDIPEHLRNQVGWLESDFEQ